MRVCRVCFDHSDNRYLLVDKDGLAFEPVRNYLEYLGRVGKSKYTVKTYCYALKHYFTYMDEAQKDFRLISLEDLIIFLGWLRSSGQNMNRANEPKSEKTINLTISVVIYFYMFLYQSGDLSHERFQKIINSFYVHKRNHFPSTYLQTHHYNNSVQKALKLKEPRKRVTTLTKKQVIQVIRATTNIRDAFLLALLYETGLRIGEALALFHEDFIEDSMKGPFIRLVNRGELENGTKLKTFERELFVSHSLFEKYGTYISYCKGLINRDPNFVFLKLRGIQKGQPMNYNDVASLFRCLRKKTGISVHPHMFRHTHGEMFYQTTHNCPITKERMGHAHVQTTMNFYDYLSEEMIRKEWERAQMAFKLGM